jgi:DUF1009 family protein
MAKSFNNNITTVDLVVEADQVKDLFWNYDNKTLNIKHLGEPIKMIVSVRNEDYLVSIVDVESNRKWEKLNGKKYTQLERIFLLSWGKMSLKIVDFL